MSINVPEALTPLWGNGFEHYALYGGRGGGKSHGIAEPAIAHCCQRKERVVCGRQYQNSIKDSVKELLEKKVHSMGMAAYFTTTDRELLNVSTGSRISFVGMDRNPESAKSLEGCTLFWGEEAQTFTKRSIEIILPTIRAAGSRFMWSWNPRFRTDAIDDLFRGKAPPEASYIKHVSWRDNPYFYRTRMPSEFRRSLRANPKRHIHIWEGGYDENPDAGIFTDWSIGRIAIPDKVIPRFGMDYGYGSDPNAIIKVYVIEPEQLGRSSDELGVIYIAQESVGYKVPNRNIPALMDVLTDVRHWPVTADTARPETTEYVNSKGFNVYSARKGAGSVKNGINFLTGYHLLIDPDCPVTTEEVRMYQWKMDPDDKPLPMPAEYQQDHCIDAIRYAVEDLSTNDSSGDGVDYV